VTLFPDVAEGFRHVGGMRAGRLVAPDRVLVWALSAATSDEILTD
jgi:hypothetical protein